MGKERERKRQREKNISERTHENKEDQKDGVKLELELVEMGNRLLEIINSLTQ